MKTNRRVFIKKLNWTLAGIIGMLGFSGCKKDSEENELVCEYGTPHADYTVKGAVINKSTGTPIEGIRVEYTTTDASPPMFNPPNHVLTNTKGEYKLTNRFFPHENLTLPIAVEDVNGSLYQSEILQVNFKDAEHSGKPTHWYKGEYTVNMNIELTEIEKE